MSAALPVLNNSNFSEKDTPTWELYGACVHCGLCLNHCPTYRVLGLEMDSPRGRIRQVLEVDQGHLEIGPDFVTHIDRCLDCRACETACPSGVQYGRIVERARAQIEQRYQRSSKERAARKFFYGYVLKKDSRLKNLSRLMRLYQRSGLETVAHVTGMTRALGVSELAALSPRMEKKFFTEIGQTFPAFGPKRGRVAFHAGCIQQVAFAELNRASIRSLQHNGVEVHVPAGQQCCGALHAHAGMRDDARELARTNIAAIDPKDYDAIVTNAAGCGSTLKEYDDLLEQAPDVEAAKRFSASVRDLSEYLASIGLVSPKRELSRRVVYQDACHLLHGQHIKSQPRELLKRVGAEIVDVAHADQCCGSAGTYNISQTELSMQILDRKMEDILGVDPGMVVTANVGCQLQLRYGMKKAGRNIPVLHIAEALECCYR